MGGGGRDSLAARRLWLSALDAEAMFQSESALVRLRRARDVDPSFLPAQVDYIALRWQFGDFFGVRREYARPDPRGGVVTRCLALATAALTTGQHPPAAEPYRLLAALDPRDRTGCSATFLSQLTAWDQRPGQINRASVAYARRAIALAPEIAANWSTLARDLAAGGDESDAARVAMDGLRRSEHPLSEALAYQRAVDLLLTGRDSVGALQLAITFAPTAFRDGRPYLTAVACQVLAEVRQPVPVRCRRGLEGISQTGDWYARLGSLRGRAQTRIDGGAPRQAVQLLDEAMALADRGGSAGSRMQLLVLRARAEFKSGSLGPAAADLRAAIALEPVVQDQYWIAEAWHNLAHTFEAKGQWVEAVAAVDTFAALTSDARWSDQRMISRYDGAVIRWEAGWHAAADSAFETMVRIVEDQRRNEYFAGEYYERVGDLDRARHYYALAADVRHGPGDWHTQALAGLTRIYEALGKFDSAEAAATDHDASERDWVPLDSPLMPSFLARHGRPGEGVTLAESWVDRQLRGGNVAGAALAGVAAARLALESGDASGALTQAARADSLAAMIHSIKEEVEAGALRGSALLRLGRGDEGLAQLQRAARLAIAHPTADAVLSTQLALGNALAEAGEITKALKAYDRAARSTELVTGLLSHDFDRVGYRARHLEPYDGALSLLLGMPDSPARDDQLVTWVQRRGAAALALAVAGARRRPTTVLPRRELQSRLTPRDVLIDYVVLDSMVAALVTTNAHLTAVRLGVSPSQLRLDVARLRVPQAYAGRVDLARTPFDLSAAEGLYDDLVRPLLPLFGTRDRLAIVPDGVLGRVPFAALVTSQARAATGYLGAHYMLDDFEIRYLPSIEFLPDGETTGRSGAVLAVSEDAPGSDSEVATIKRLGEGRVTILAGAEATETAVRSLGARYDILHFAAHSLASDKDPLASHIRLRPDHANDGFFHLTEIAEQRWRPSLVFLSGCETVTGPDAPGEGMIGLARAFLLSGARNVVATAWPIGDQSAHLVDRFYRELFAGTDPATALRLAQLDLRHSSSTSHPFYWGAFETIEGG